MLGLEFSVAEVSGLRITKSSAFVVCCGGRRPPLRFCGLLLAAEAGDLRYDIASFVTVFF